jgi:hypothetical protein
MREQDFRCQKVAIRTMLAKRYVFMVKKMHKKIMMAIALLPVLGLPSWTISDTKLISNPSNSSKIIDNFVTPSADAVQLRDGKTYFVQLPMLLEAVTTLNWVYAHGATYYFEISLPQNMGEPLQKLEIFQVEGGDSIDFFRNETIAYLKSASGDRAVIPSKTEIFPSTDRDRPKIVVTFDPPIPASNELKNNLVVGLRPIQNPRYEGVYLFGVSASPQGNQPNSQFLGYGRLSFYDSHY